MFLPDVAPFSLPPAEKSRYLAEQLRRLLDHHRQHCAGYARLVSDWEQHRRAEDWSVDHYPFIPVTAFKEYALRSTDNEVATVRSSATTSGKSSNIFVDRSTKKRQSLSAAKILTDFVGGQQRPYLVFDVEATVRGTESLSARGAAILSLAHLASEFLFVMRDADGQLQLDLGALASAIEKIGQRPFLAYGFTYLLYRAHQDLSNGRTPLRPAHPESVLLHSGGWKRLSELAVDKASFNRTVSAPWGLPAENVIDFYGTVEQVGVPYPDCRFGHKHVPYWADVVIRKADSLAAADCHETGLIQLINCLPLSAPNHSVLTEDLGRLALNDGCPCGRRGKAFVFEGRAPRSELRGCSDVARY